MAATSSSRECGGAGVAPAARGATACDKDMRRLWSTGGMLHNLGLD